MKQQSNDFVQTKHCILVCTWFVGICKMFKKCLFNPYSSSMEWSEAHDIQLCREIMVTNPFSAKRKTSDRKRLWETIARNLVKINSPKFKTSLSERAVRERYMRIAQRFKAKMNEEIKASGISPEQSELDVLLEELTEREEMAEEERFQQGKKSEKDQEKAKDIRLKAMEKLSQTKKRKSEENSDDPPKKSRRVGSETLSFLKEKNEREMDFKQKELELRSKEYEEERKRRDEAEKRQDSMMQMFVQQNQLMLSLISKLTDK